MKLPPNDFFSSRTYQYLTNYLIVEEHLTRCFTENMHLVLEYEDMQTQIPTGCKKEQTPQWEVPLWVTVLRHEVADNDSRIRGQWCLKNLTLELSISDASNNPQDRDVLHYWLWVTLAWRASFSCESLNGWMLFIIPWPPGFKCSN